MMPQREMQADLHILLKSDTTIHHLHRDGDYLKAVIFIEQKMSLGHVPVARSGDVTSGVRMASGPRKRARSPSSQKLV